ncbi:hypothetical protein SCHPADRAFT_939302 [Schizopora paradoxa]|uniref:PAS domain-containing protein n=1 Tax=Schizopora paradoxa TaxID=27342 RepID=A0A0H2SCR8_9AGAM|nr:hypothetical protein SCHPADRAFT_939302 [Schizopora paradoxa]
MSRIGTSSNPNDRQFALQKIRATPKSFMPLVRPWMSSVGYEDYELVGNSCFALVKPEELDRVREVMDELRNENKSACLIYLHLRHKNPNRGYPLCACTYSNVEDVVVGGISLAYSGNKPMQNASTATEVVSVTPSASQFEYRRWNDRRQITSHPRSLPSIPSGAVSAASAAVHDEVQPKVSQSATPSPNLSASSEIGKPILPLPPSSSVRPQRASPPRSISKPPPSPSTSLSVSASSSGFVYDEGPRTALILDRFSLDNGILYVTNDSILGPREAVLGRSFYDFVLKADEKLVRGWMDVVKTWGVNDRGNPSDGGSGYAKFRIDLNGRDSKGVHHRRTPPNAVSASSQPYPPRAAYPQQPTRTLSSNSASTSPTSSRPRPQARNSSERGVNSTASLRSSHERRNAGERDSEVMRVDAILSPQSDGIIVILRPTA